MSLELLPSSHGLRLCSCEGERVEPLADFPCAQPDLWCWSDDRSHALAVDQGRKRVTTFRLEDQDFVRTMSPLALPRNVKANCIAMKGPQPYIGATSIWLPDSEGGWLQTPMPGFARGAGKRLDGLLFDGDRLVAVDDLVLPKWNLEYDVATPDQPRYVRAVEIRANTSYERIFAAAGGKRWFATLSRGINHGNSSSFCSVFDLATLESAWTWPFSRAEGQRRAAIELTRVVFLDDVLCLLAQPSAPDDPAVLHWLDLSEAPSPLPPLRERRKQRPEIRAEPLQELAAANDLVATADGSGVYVCGRSPGGEPSVLWRAAGGG